ncbi:hypothetical protein B2J93_2618 [Marssonina coronariae]|uniref:Uncharacterized protein n=1 Tax=Diplocarpon coronariae TaxID=2795749 RepID=A0A218Z8A5_9HELO|nr:hypothetical protein B2J93_2618 [Marssonina coronariae]
MGSVRNPAHMGEVEPFARAETAGEPTELASAPNTTSTTRHDTPRRAQQVCTRPWCCPFPPAPAPASTPTSTPTSTSSNHQSPTRTPPRHPRGRTKTGIPKARSYGCDDEAEPRHGVQTSALVSYEREMKWSPSEKRGSSPRPNHAEAQTGVEYSITPRRTGRLRRASPRLPSGLGGGASTDSAAASAARFARCTCRGNRPTAA